MSCSTPGLPVLHCLPEFAQTHVLLVSSWLIYLGAQCAAPPSLPPRAAAGGSLHWPSFGIESSSVVMMWVVAVSVNGGILHLAMIVNEPSPGTWGWPACWRTNPAWTLAWQNLFIGKDRKRLNE